MSLDHATNIVKHQSPTRDAFLAGRLIIAQPAKGFRAGLDSVLLGGAVSADAGKLLDLGGGVGTAALVALAQHPHLGATLVESDSAMLALATENLTGNGFAGRAGVLALDVTAAGAIRTAAGLEADHYAAVIANPPFFVAGQGTAAQPGRRAARHMDAAGLDLWVRTAAASAAPGGEVIFILPAESLAVILQAFAPRFGALTLLPLSPRSGEPATRLLIRGIKGSRAPLTLLANRPLHLVDGQGFTPEIDAVLRGETRLRW